MKNMAYKWKTGFYKASAEDAGKVFAELESTVGLTPKAVVDASRDESAPLHSEFEWDDAVAGEKWREQQARVMICSLTVTIDDGQEEPVRAFVQIAPRGEAYENIVTVLDDDDKTAAMLSKAMGELRQFRRKYNTLQKLAGVFKEIDKLREAV